MRQLIQVAAPGPGPYLLIGTYLPLKSLWQLPAFIRLSGRVGEQLKATPGVVCYGINSDILRRRFWTCSVWNAGSQESVQDFVYSGAHAETLTKVAAWAGGREAFARWTSPNPAVDFDELLRRLPPG
jgi:hypothetical protein